MDGSNICYGYISYYTSICPNPYTSHIIVICMSIPYGKSIQYAWIIHRHYILSACFYYGICWISLRNNTHLLIDSNASFINSFINFYYASFFNSIYCRLHTVEMIIFPPRRGVIVIIIYINNRWLWNSCCKMPGIAFILPKTIVYNNIPVIGCSLGQVTPYNACFIAR